MRKRKILCLLMAVIMCASLFNGLMFKSEAMAAEDGLVVHLKFDDDLTDSSGTGNDASCEYGKISYEDGIFGKSAVFNGKSFIEIPDSDSLDLRKLTISLWVYKVTPLRDYERMPYVYKEKDEDHWSVPYLLYEHGDNIPLFYLHEDDTELDQFRIDGAPIDIRKWHLLTATFDGNEARIYENGELLKKKDVSGAPYATLGDLYIGLDEWGDAYYKGNMDDFRIYNRALSAKEVDALYSAGLAESPELLTQTNAMIAHYKFNGDNKDASEFGNDADVAAGKLTYVDGKNGKAATFKKGTYLEVADNISLDFDEGFSMTGWIKPTVEEYAMSILNRPGVSTSENSDDLSFRILMMHDYFGLDYTPFEYQTYSNRYGYTTDNSMKNKWVHLGITFDTNEIRFYNNGKMVKKEKVSDYNGDEMAHGLGDLMIGSDGENFFVGSMDELKLYNYPLSAKQVEADYKEVDSLSVSKDNETKIKSMKKGNTVTLVTSRNYIETGKTTKLTKGVTYKTSNKKIFTVSSKGRVKAIGKGSTTLTITHGAISKTYKITVK